MRNAIALRAAGRDDRGPFGPGIQFRSHAFVRTLRDNNLTGSMGRVGACGDNAAMESFFSLLQKNVLDRQRWETREELRLAIVTWIERTYHRRRRQRALGRLTPIEFEMILQPPNGGLRTINPTSQRNSGQSLRVAKQCEPHVRAGESIDIACLDAAMPALARCRECR